VAVRRVGQVAPPDRSGTFECVPHNPFATDLAATMYARGRPDYSKRVGDIVRRLIDLTGVLPRALDVGSGTGISTLALAPLADEVIGVEASAAMVERAARAANVSYRLGYAEVLPVDDASCDLIAVGSALHWFDQESFLAEASRVAKPHAWLVIHDHWFAGQMEGVDEFGVWARGVYLETYPSPPRDRSWRPPADLGEWRHVDWEQYEHSIPFDVDRLADYLLTQSNLQVVVERGDGTPEELKDWLVGEMRPFFGAETASLRFGGFVACHRR
jgi:SAM-dependent methyltransferase